MEKGSKVLGVIGGMGPAASHLFYGMIIKHTKAVVDQDHIDMIILSHATIPDRTKAIINKEIDSSVKKLIEDGKKLEREGASCVAITCNTAHAFISEIQREINIPIINMIEETVNEVWKKYGRKKIKIGVLATDGTLMTETYQDECRKVGIEPYLPSEKIQKLVMKLIYDDVKRGKPVDPLDFKKIEAELKREGCDGAIMACTELSVIKEELNLPEFYTDAMLVLAQKSILFCDKELAF